jgi:glycosyltransferase involved in cell wall biosynthesis
MTTPSTTGEPRRLRVLHVLPFPGLGGVEVATRRVADAVRPFGVESTALLLKPVEQLTRYLEDAGIPCLTDARRPEPSLVREAAPFLRDSRALARVCAGYDIVHCSDVAAAYYAAVAGRLAGAAVICHVRNRDGEVPYRNRVFIGAASHFAFVSRDTRDRFAMRLPLRRTTVLYDGVDIPPAVDRAARDALAAEVRAELQLPADAVLVAMFARVNPQKDYPTLIRAAARLRDSHPRVRFLIVGDNDRVPTNREHYAEVSALAASAGVLDRLVFTGFREDTQRLMQAADICLLCTHFEGLPLVVLEAMAAGRPSVATAVDGVPEALTDGLSGLLHAHQDADGLAAAIARLAEAPELAERLGANARAEAARRFSRDRFARDVYALYSRLAPGRTPPVSEVSEAAS